MSTILTAAGESLIARLQAEGKALIIDTMILANVPGQDHTQAIAPGVTVPAEAQIALRYAIPPQYRAYVNPNQVVYSAMLGSDMGDFTFNWQGLWCSEHNTLVAVATFPALEKRRYDEANGKTGNNLTRNFLLTFTGARELTGLTISADVWQLDFTVRLNGIDERQRLANFDIYGQAFFDGQGWLLQKTAEAYAFAPGLGYVGGIRAALAESLPLAAPESANLPQNVWLDVCLKPTGSDRIAEASPMLTPPAAPLADSAADETGLMHYRALVARIEADGTVTDLRPRKTSGALPIPDIATPEVAGTMRPDGVTCTVNHETAYLRVSQNCRYYTVPGVNSFEVPTTAEYEVTVIGAGGGGGPATSPGNGRDACAGGGGAGGMARKLLTLQKGEKIIVTVGMHGIGGLGASMTPATAGGTSSFGIYVSATGGRPGDNANSWNDSYGPLYTHGGAGGKGIGGDINALGGGGCSAGPGGSYKFSPSGGNAGTGGNSYLSAGPINVEGEGPSGILGAGGAGADTGNFQITRNGGNGGDGVVIIKW